MSHLIDKQFVERAEGVVLLSLLWSGLAGCIIAALAFDIAYWFAR